MSDIGVTFCGGKIDNFGLQACITRILAGPSLVEVRSHAVKLFELRETGVFIRNPPMIQNFGLSRSFLAVTSVHPYILSLLLPHERSVDAYSSLFRWLPSLDKENALLLMDIMTSTVVGLKNITTPFKT